MFKATITLLAAVTAFSCATTHPGKVGHAISEKKSIPLKVSARNVPEGTDDQFQLVEFTIENESSSWVKLDKTDVVIEDPSSLSVVLGDDLRDWATAEKLKLEKEKHNKDLMKLGLIGAGAAVAIASGGKGSAAALGTAAMVGGEAWAVTDAINAAVDSVNGVEKLPENHLYHTSSIPSKMFIRKWVLLNKTTKTDLKTLTVGFTTVEGQKESYELPL